MTQQEEQLAAQMADFYRRVRASDDHDAFRIEREALSRQQAPSVVYRETKTPSKSLARPVEEPTVPPDDMPAPAPPPPPASYTFTYSPQDSESEPYLHYIVGSCVVTLTPDSRWPSGNSYYGTYGFNNPGAPQGYDSGTINCIVYNDGTGWKADAAAEDGEIEGPQNQNPANSTPPGTYGDITIS